MSHLVDTDLVIDGLTGASDALAHLTARVSEPLAISVISLGELFEGVDDADPAAGLEAIRLFISGYRRLGLTEDVMLIFARLRRQLRRQGNVIPDLDLLIAATALHYDLVLLTRNQRHFGRVPGLRLEIP